VSIRRHTTYNLIGGIIPIVVSLVSIPLYLGLIGAERYGVLALAWLLLGYFSVFDLGLSKATAQRIASRRDTAGDRALTFWSALVVNALTGLAGGIFLYFVSDLVLTHYLKIAPSLRAEVIASVPYLAATVPVATIGGVVSGALLGRERFLEVNAISTASTILTQLAPIATAWLIGVHLSGLILSALAARVLALLLLWQQCRRHVTAGAGPRISRAEVLALLGFGGWVTISAFVGPLMTVLDRFVIGAVIGAVAVTTYTIPWQLAQRLLILPSSLQLALFPRQAAAGAAEQTRLTLEGIRAVAAVTTPLVVGGIFLMEPFLKLWIGGDFHLEAAKVGRIALLGFWGTGMAYVPFAQVEARGHARTAALVHLAELPLYLAALFLLMNAFGLPGAAWAFTLRCLADAAVFNRLCLKRDAAWAGPLFLTFLLTACVVAGELLPPLGWGWAAAFAVGLAAACGLSYAFAPEALRSFAARFLSRLPIRRLPS
jgi:O-antigen/teichoic acid export membrane protein